MATAVERRTTQIPQIQRVSCDADFGYLRSSAVASVKGVLSVQRLAILGSSFAPM
jgi:hypothetical protein